MTQDLSEPTVGKAKGIPQKWVNGKSEIHHKINLIVGGTLAHNEATSSKKSMSWTPPELASRDIVLYHQEN